MKLTIYILAVFVLFMTACNTPKKSNSTKVESSNQATMVGADKDEHGCKGSAGYQWSAIRQECIRVFEVGIRLNPISKELDPTTSAFVVFKSAEIDIEVELFMPSVANSILLSKNGKSMFDQWKNDNYTLTKNSDSYQLLDKNGLLLYEGTINK